MRVCVCTISLFCWSCKLVASLRLREGSQSSIDLITELWGLPVLSGCQRYSEDDFWWWINRCVNIEILQPNMVGCNHPKPQITGTCTAVQLLKNAFSLVELITGPSSSCSSRFWMMGVTSPSGSSGHTPTRRSKEL